MRKAITRAWKLTDDSSKLEIFGTYALHKGWMPTNSELIYVLADRLRCKAMLETETSQMNSNLIYVLVDSKSHINHFQRPYIILSNGV